MKNPSDAIDNKEKKGYVSNIIKLAGSTILAQIISIIIAPLLTRLYLPEAFGIQTLYISILGLIIVIACLRTEVVILLPKKDEEAMNIFKEIKSMEDRLLKLTKMEFRTLKKEAKEEK